MVVKISDVTSLARLGFEPSRAELFVSSKIPQARQYFELLSVGVHIKATFRMSVLGTYEPLRLEKCNNTVIYCYWYARYWFHLVSLLKIGFWLVIGQNGPNVTQKSVWFVSRGLFPAIRHPCALKYGIIHSIIFFVMSKIRVSKFHW